MGSHTFLQGIFPTQGSNPGLLHCRQILYQLSHEGSPKILEWVALQNSVGKGMKLGIHLWEPEPQVKSLTMVKPPCWEEVQAPQRCHVHAL